jgi:hypothetical protein
MFLFLCLACEHLVFSMLCVFRTVAAIQHKLPLHSQHGIDGASLELPSKIG